MAGRWGTGIATLCFDGDRYSGPLSPRRISARSVHLFTLPATTNKMASWAILIPLFITDQGDKQLDWSTPEVSEHDVSPPSSPSFAPVGRPTIKKRFRSKIPDPLRLDVPRNRTSRLGSLHLSYSVSRFCLFFSFLLLLPQRAAW